MCFTHSIRSSPIVTEFSCPMCCFLINSIASHFAEWGVKEFSRHHLFSSDKALFKEATVLSAVSPMQYTVLSYACIKTELEVIALGRSLWNTIRDKKYDSIFSFMVGHCGRDIRNGHEFTRKRTCIILVRDDSAQANFRFDRGVLALTRHLARLMTTRVGIVQRAALSTMTRRAAKAGEGWMKAEPRRTTGRKYFTLKVINGTRVPL